MVNHYKMPLPSGGFFLYNIFMKKFPDVIPVFPLSGVIYFPKTNLPLNIFEQRYLDLVNDAYKKDKLMSIVKSKKGDISENTWNLFDVNINKFDKGISSQSYVEDYKITSNYNYGKITSLFKNFDTMSFLDLILNYDELQKKGYNKSYIDKNLNSMLAMPFFLFIMTSLASILTMNTLKKSNNFAFIIAGLIACVAIYYFKDLSLALGQANRISLSLAVWIPVIAIGLFSSIGVLQINEK